MSMGFISNPHDQQVHVDLLTFLEAKYKEAMEKKHEQLRAESALRGIDVAARLREIRRFVDFAKDYLDRHRPARTFQADRNIGVELDNRLAFVLSRPLPQGGMQPGAGAAVSFSGAKIGQPGVEDRSRDQPSEDLTAERGPKKYR